MRPKKMRHRLQTPQSTAQQHEIDSLAGLSMILRFVEACTKNCQIELQLQWTPSINPLTAPLGILGILGIRHSSQSSSGSRSRTKPPHWAARPRRRTQATHSSKHAAFHARLVQLFERAQSSAKTSNSFIDAGVGDKGKCLVSAAGQVKPANAVGLALVLTSLACAPQLVQHWCTGVVADRHSEKVCLLCLDRPAHRLFPALLNPALRPGARPCPCSPM